MLRRDTTASILDADGGFVGALIDVNLDDGPGLAVLGRVVHEIDDRLFQQQCVDRRLRTLCADRIHLHLFLFGLDGGQIDDRDEDALELLVLKGDRPPLRPVLKPGQARQIIDDGIELMRVVADDVHVTARLLRNGARLPHERPEQASDVLVQIKRLLPTEGYLTQRMAQLRQKAYQGRKGHIARLEETRQVFPELPASARKKAAADLAAKYRQMIGIGTRLERLDRAVAENEKRIRNLTAGAQTHTTRYEDRELCEDLKAAQRLQHHNTRLLEIIERTEQKLSAVAKQIAQEVKQVEKPDGRT